MSTTSVGLLRTASRLAGGDKALAERLIISEALLARYMSGRFALSERVLLAAVDIILESREARRPRPETTLDSAADG